jgi:ABC-type cobalt transport system substrate-binding protein
MKFRLTFLSLFIFYLNIPAQDVTVAIDLSKPLITSTFHAGVTHTHGFWEYGNQTAVERARTLLINGISVQNQHIMGWGAGNPEPQAGAYQWNDLDHRVDLMRSIETPMIITFCTAPGWMKGTDDWAMEEEVEDDHVDAFAELCAAIANRYPDVQYFQVWNEMKGYWSTALNNWDYIRYTALYNAVYDAVKAARTDAKIGGPYLVIQGDGGAELGKSGQDTFAPIGSRDWTVINYWLQNKHGADFFCFDYGLIDYHDPNQYSKSEKMQLTHHFGRILQQIREKTDLPIVISEFYGGSDETDLQFTAANHASCYYHAIINNAFLGLVWNPQQGEIENYLFSDTQTADGGQPTPHYAVVKAINNYFSQGTQLYQTTTSSGDIDVLASADKTLLINKTETMLTVQINGETTTLNRYQVKVIDTPVQTGIKSGYLPASPEIRVVYASWRPLLQIYTPRSTKINIRIFDILGRKLEEDTVNLNARSRNTIRLFHSTSTHAAGIYFAAIRGLETHIIKRFYLLK